MSSVKSNTTKSASLEETDELERLRLAYLKAKETGSAELEPAREAYQDFAAKLVIDLSGKLDPADHEAIPTKPTEGFIKDGGKGRN